MNLTGQIDTWRIHLVLEGVFFRVKLMQLILFSLALDLTSVFLLLELHFLDRLEQAETIREEGRVEGESILFCYTPFSVSKISTQEYTGLHLVAYRSRAVQILLMFLLWLSYLTMNAVIHPAHLILLFFLITVKNRHVFFSARNG